MRIAYICADRGVPVFGQKGCSIHVQEVIRSLQRLGAQVELFATRSDGVPPSELEAVTVHKLPAISKGDREVREQASLSANQGLRQALEQAGPFDLIYERYSLWSFAGMEYAQAIGVPGLLEVNAPLIQEQEKHRGLVDRVSAEQVAERVFRAATALLAVSEEIKTYLEEYPDAKQRVHVVPNGVNPDRFSSDVRPLLSPSPGTFTVGFVGTLKPWHGLPILVEAFDRLHQRSSETRLLIVGDGPERENLVADLSSRGLLEAVHFTGAVAPDDIPGWLASMDVAVAPYPDQANFYFSPLKVYEYMAAALPVVASQIGQLTTLIKDGVNGLLCPAGDAVALAAALARLQQSPELGIHLGHTARETMKQNHSWDKVAQGILHLAELTPMPQVCLEIKV
ncbi:MAG: glycosyltransferase family 4 protein [Leptolyngbyaceae cyanobacterium MO_188.B28]|nr:glycosyltransferase family 4 protein [Leptolyngbyaceae cyanobacterium MO_188.B28]